MMKRTLCILFVTIVIATVVAVGTRSVFGQHAKVDDDQGVGGWEYLVLQGGTVNFSPSDSRLRKAEAGFSREFFPLETNMDKLGAKGWELVAVTGSTGDPTYYFKRKK